MPAPLSVIATLLLFSALGGYTFILSSQHGLFEQLDQICQSSSPHLPNTHAPLRRSFTGLQGIDHQLQILMLFFHDAISGQFPASSIQVAHFAGQIVPGWMVVVLEGYRAGNSGRLIAYSVIWGLLAQNLSFAFIIPLYAAMHLYTSPTTRPTATNIAVAPSVATSLPYAITLGFILPSIIMALPAPSVVSYDTEQLVNAFWQLFPLWVSLAHLLLRRALPSTVSRSAIRGVYIFGLLISALSHISTLALTLFPSLSPFPLASPIDFRTTFIPSTVLGHSRKPTIAEGAHILLQYDEIVGSTALVIWTAYLHSQFGSGTKSAWRALGWTALLGPCGAAMALVWDRDETVLASERKEE